MANEIAKVTLPNNKTYFFKDADARNRLDTLENLNTTAIRYRGTTEVNLRDGTNISPLTLSDGTELTPVSGDIVLTTGDPFNPSQAPREFIYDGTKWNEFGSTGSLKALAFKNSVTGSYKPEGTISGTFQGSSSTITLNFTPKGKIGETVSPTFVGTASIITVKGNINNATVSTKYTPAGEVSAPDFFGHQSELIVGERSGASSYTPSGTVDTPQIHIATTKTSVVGLQSAGTLPSFSMSVDSDQVLSFGFDAGELPTYETKEFISDINNIYSDPVYFHGNGARLATDYTPSGDINAPIFTGTEATLTATVTAPLQTMTANYIPVGSVTTPSFDGLPMSVTTSFSPNGSIQGLAFSGTTKTFSAN